MRKQRTREHIIADLSINHVERHFLLAGHTAQRVIFDYGYDLFVQTFNKDGELDEGYLLIQAKATESLRRVSGGREAAVTVARGDVVSWLSDTAPVALILYDASAETAYFLLIEAGALTQQVAARSGATMTLRIPISNILNASAIERLHIHKNGIFSPKENDGTDL